MQTLWTMSGLILSHPNQALVAYAARRRGNKSLPCRNPAAFRDLDGAYGAIFIRRLRSIGIRDRPTSPRFPLQNGYAERLIGSISRECIDHIVVFGERHLRHVLLSYMRYYNGTRTHLSLNKDAPISRAAETTGRICCRPILGGLHRQYVRIRFATGTSRNGTTPGSRMSTGWCPGADSRQQNKP